MIEFGKTLRSAREAKGYTASQVAKMKSSRKNRSWQKPKILHRQEYNQYIKNRPYK